MILALVGLWLVAQPVSAFFSNGQTAPAQSFQASSLVLEPLGSLANVEVSEAGTPAAFTLSVATQAGSVPAQFDVTGAVVDGDAEWCNSLVLSATSTTGAAYAAPASSFASAAESAAGVWQLAVTSSDAATTPVGTMCTLSVTVTAWQENLSKGMGYQDTHTLMFDVVRTDVLASLPESIPADLLSESVVTAKGSGDETVAAAAPVTDTPPPVAPVVESVEPVVEVEADVPAETVETPAAVERTWTEPAPENLLEDTFDESAPNTTDAAEPTEPANDVVDQADTAADPVAPAPEQSETSVSESITPPVPPAQSTDPEPAAPVEPEPVARPKESDDVATDDVEPEPAI